VLRFAWDRAGHLVAQGMTLKKVGHRLGHRSAYSTRTYTKVDLPNRSSIQFGGSTMNVSAMAAQYVAFKRSLGMRFNSDEQALKSFCRYVRDAPYACGASHE